MKHIVIYLIADKGTKLTNFLAIHRQLNNTRAKPGEKVKLVIDIIVNYDNKVALIHQGKVIYVNMVPDQFFEYKFIRKVINRFTLINSDCKILLLSGHGEGWFMHDTGIKHVVQFNEISRAMRELDVKVDLLALDLCFGAGVEIIYQFRDVAHYLIASQEDLYCESLIPGLVELENCVDINNVMEVAKNYIRRGDDKSEPTSISVIDIAGMCKLINVALKLPWDKSDLNLHIVDDPETYCRCADCDPRECTLFQDFLYLMSEKVKNDIKFREQFDEYCKFYKTRYCHTAGTGVNFSLAMWLNNKRSSPLFNKLYAELDINKLRTEFKVGEIKKDENVKENENNGLKNNGLKVGENEKLNA